jgi:hypothetical protein
MKLTYGMALAAALLFGCSSGSKSTKTAGNDTGITQSGSISGTQGTAAGATGTQGTSTASAGTSNTPNNPGATVSGQGTVDTNTQSSMGTQGSSMGTQGSVSATQQQGTPRDNPPAQGTIGGTSSGTSATIGGTTAQSSTGTSGSVNAPPAAVGSSGAVSGSVSDNSNLRTVTGAVAKVDQNSITLDQSAGGVTLTVDSQTQVIRKGKAGAGLSSIHEGEQVRASFDPASNRAEKIEVMGRSSGKLMKHHKDTTSGMNNPSDVKAPEAPPAPADNPPEKK